MQRYQKVKTRARLRKIQVLLLQRTLNELRAQLNMSPIQFDAESDSGDDMLIGIEEGDQQNRSGGDNQGSGEGAAAGV